MTIMLNQRATELDAQALSVSVLLATVGSNAPLMVVKLNGQVIHRSQFETAIVHNGDVVDIIHLIGGG